MRRRERKHDGENKGALRRGCENVYLEDQLDSAGLAGVANEAHARPPLVPMKRDGREGGIQTHKKRVEAREQPHIASGKRRLKQRQAGEVTVATTRLPQPSCELGVGLPATCALAYVDDIISRWALAGPCWHGRAYTHS